MCSTLDAIGKEKRAVMLVQEAADFGFTVRYKSEYTKTQQRRYVFTYTDHNHFSMNFEKQTDFKKGVISKEEYHAWRKVAVMMRGTMFLDLARRLFPQADWNKSKTAIKEFLGDTSPEYANLRRVISYEEVE